MRTLAALSIVVLASCGGGNGDEDALTPKERYERAFQNAVEATEREGERLPDPPDDAPLPEQAEQLRQGVLLIRRLADRLASIDPPGNIAHAHARFVKGLRLTADDATAIVRAAQAGDEARIDTLLGGAGPQRTFVRPRTARLVGTARAEFQRKGYEVTEPLPGLPGG